VYAENKKVVGSPSGMGPDGTVEGRMGDADGVPGGGLHRKRDGSRVERGETLCVKSDEDLWRRRAGPVSFSLPGSARGSAAAACSHRGPVAAARVSKHPNRIIYIYI